LWFPKQEGQAACANYHQMYSFGTSGRRTSGGLPASPGSSGKLSLKQCACTQSNGFILEKSLGEMCSREQLALSNDQVRAATLIGRNAIT